MDTGNRGIAEGAALGLALLIVGAVAMLLFGGWGLAVVVVLMMAGFVRAAW